MHLLLRPYKARKYQHIDCHAFAPIAIESMGNYGPQTLTFLKELGRRMSRCLRLWRGIHVYLSQRLSVAIQWGNAASCSSWDCCMLTINILSRQPCLCRCQFSLDINFVLFVFLLDKILMFKPLTSFFGEYLAHMQQAQDCSLSVHFNA